MGVYVETISLEDDVSPQARTAQTALGDMTNALDAANAQLVKSQALGDDAGYAKALADVGRYTSAIDKIKPMAADAINSDANKDRLDQQAKAQEAYDAKLAESQDKATAAQAEKWATVDHVMQVAKASVEAATQDMGRAFDALAQGDAKGAIEGFTDAIGDMAKLLDLVVPGLGEAVSLLIKIGGGLVGVTVGLVQSGAEFAVEANEAQAAMLRMFDAMGDGVSTGAELNEMLSNMSDTLGISKDQLAGYTKAFLKMGVTGTESLQALTTAALSANVVVGEGGAEAFETLEKKIQAAASISKEIKLDPRLIRSLGDAGITVEDIAKGFGKTREELKGASLNATQLSDVITTAITEKGAKGLDAFSSSAANLKGKFISDIKEMFLGVGPNVEGLMEQVKSLFEIFSQSEPSGKALKDGITGFFSETLDLAKELVPMVKHFLLDMIIYGLEAYLALAPVYDVLANWLSSTEGLQLQSDMWRGLADTFRVLAPLAAALIGTFILMAAISAEVVVGLEEIVGAVTDLTDDMADAVAGLVASAIKIGSDFVSGIIQGITGGKGVLAESVSDLGQSAIDTIKGVLKINSPSLVMQDVGESIGEGLVGGMGNAQNDVEAAGSDLASSASTGASTSAGPGGPSVGMRSGDTTINVYIEGAGKSAEEITDEMVAAAWERMALASGM